MSKLTTAWMRVNKQAISSMESIFLIASREGVTLDPFFGSDAHSQSLRFSIRRLLRSAAALTRSRKPSGTLDKPQHAGYSC